MGAVRIKFRGTRRVSSNLNKEIIKIRGRTMVGLIEAAVLVRRDMDETPPLIPVDTNNLRGSYFTTTIKDPLRPQVILGFSANYAMKVHEMVGADFSTPRWRYRKGRKKWYKPRPGAGPKFLESALKRNHGAILETIRQNAKIK